MNAQTYIEIMLWGLIGWGTLYFLHQMYPHAELRGIQKVTHPTEETPKLVRDTRGQ